MCYYQFIIVYDLYFESCEEIIDVIQIITLQAAMTNNFHFLIYILFLLSYHIELHYHIILQQEPIIIITIQEQVISINTICIMNLQYQLIVHFTL